MRSLNVLPTFLIAGCLSAQIRDLTTDQTGSVLYFASESVLANKPTSARTKLFRWARGEGVATYLERPYEQRPLQFGRPGDYETNYYNVAGPHLSRDGTRLAYLEQGHRSQLIAGPTILWRTAVTTTSGARITEIPASGDSRPVLSPSGDYVVLGNSVFNLNGQMLGSAFLPTSSEFPLGFELTRQRISNDRSSVWVDDQHSVQLFGPGRAGVVSSTAAMSPAIDDGATVVVYETLFQTGTQRRLIAADLATGGESVLYEDPKVEGVVTGGFGTSRLLASPFLYVPAPMFGHSISADGRLVLALAKVCGNGPRRWLLVASVDGSSRRMIGPAAEGFAEAVLSGDGKVAFAVTEWGRLLRIDIATESLEEILPRTPWIARWSGVFYPGALVHVHGGGFAETRTVPSEFPASTCLGGVTARLNDLRMPMVLVAPQELVFQIPWEYPAIQSSDRLTVTVSVPSQSPLGPASLDVGVTNEAGALMRFGGRIGRAIAFEERGFFHEDASRVSLASPLGPGETITVQMTGFVEPRGLTGVPFEESPYRRPAVECRVQLNPAELLGFRPAPFQIGVYEIRLKLPETSHVTGSTLTCRDGDTSEAFVSLPFRQ